MNTSCAIFVDPLVQPHRCTARIKSIRTGFGFVNGAYVRSPLPGSMDCQHVNDSGNLSSVVTSVLGFTFFKPQTTPIDVIEWLQREPQSDVKLITDERAGLQLHVVFSDPNDALLFKLTFADILERA